MEYCVSCICLLLVIFYYIGIRGIHEFSPYFRINSPVACAVLQGSFTGLLAAISNWRLWLSAFSCYAWYAMYTPSKLLEQNQSCNELLFSLTIKLLNVLSIKGLIIFLGNVRKLWKSPIIISQSPRFHISLFCTTVQNRKIFSLLKLQIVFSSN